MQFFTKTKIVGATAAAIAILGATIWTANVTDIMTAAGLNHAARDTLTWFSANWSQLWSFRVVWLMLGVAIGATGCFAAIWTISRLRSNDVPVKGQWISYDAAVHQFSSVADIAELARLQRIHNDASVSYQQVEGKAVGGWLLAKGTPMTPPIPENYMELRTALNNAEFNLTVLKNQLISNLISNLRAGKLVARGLKVDDGIMSSKHTQIPRGLWHVLAFNGYGTNQVATGGGYTYRGIEVAEASRPSKR